MGFDIKKVLGVAAPWLTAALPGPLGGIASAAISQVLGLKPDAGVEQVQEALAAGKLTGDQLIALKAADHAFELQMQAAGFENIEHLESIAEEDRASARNREIQVRDWTPRIIGYLVVGAFVGMAYAVLFRKMSADSALAGTVVGYLSAKAEQVISYYFGSSSGSDRKTELLAQAPAVTDLK